MTIYLDHAASTPLRATVYDFLAASLKLETANPQSAHVLGRIDGERIEAARVQLLQMLGADVDDCCVFTSSATEANNTVLMSLLQPSSGGVIYSQADHASIVAPVTFVEQGGVRSYLLPLTANYTVDLVALEELLLSYKPSLLILTHVNSISGHLLDVHAIAQAAKAIQPDLHIHVDAAQSFGKYPINLQERVIDSVSISAHKIGGPKGISGLYLKKDVTITPLLHGGGQEHGIRSSTPAVSLIESFTPSSERSA